MTGFLLRTIAAFSLLVPDYFGQMKRTEKKTKLMFHFLVWHLMERIVGTAMSSPVLPCIFKYEIVLDSIIYLALYAITFTLNPTLIHNHRIWNFSHISHRNRAKKMCSNEVWLYNFVFFGKGFQHFILNNHYG